MQNRVKKTDARRFVIGVGALTIGGLVAYLGVTVQGGGELPLKSYTYVTAAFNDVGTLKRGLDVTDNGVRIGTVRKVEFVDGQAVVTMRLDGEPDIYSNARASIRNESALGRKQVGLDPGTETAPLLGDKTIPATQTTSSSSLDDVFETFDPKTRESLQGALSELGGGLAGHGPDLNAALHRSPEILDALGTVSTALSSDRANLPEMLENTNRLAGRLDDRSAELTTLLVQIDDTLSAVAVDDGRPLRASVKALPRTLRETRTGLADLDEPLADLEASMTRLRPGAKALATSEPDLRGFLRESVKPLNNVPDVAKKATPAVGDLTNIMADARPLAPQLVAALDDAAVLLRGLAPYATDAGRFFSEHDLLSGELAPGKNFFSAMLVLPGLRNLSLPDPLADTVPYPTPGGGAWRDNPVTGGVK